METVPTIQVETGNGLRTGDPIVSRIRKLMCI